MLTFSMLQVQLINHSIFKISILLIKAISSEKGPNFNFLVSVDISKIALLKITTVAYLMSNKTKHKLI